MDQLVNVLLAIDKAQSTIEGPGLRTRLRCVKPGLWAQPFHSLCLGLSVASMTSLPDVQIGKMYKIWGITSAVKQLTVTNYVLHLYSGFPVFFSHTIPGYLQVLSRSKWPFSRC